MKEEKKNIKQKIEEVGKSFKKFALKGSMLEIAIGMMIGSAVSAVVSSLIKDIINPPLAKILSGVDFSHRYFVLGKNNFESLEAAQASGAVVFTYGNFINAVISFLITAFVLFCIVSWVGKLNKKEEKKEVSKTKKCPFCKSDIDKSATRCAFCTSELKKQITFLNEKQL